MRHQRFIVGSWALLLAAPVVAQQLPAPPGNGPALSNPIPPQFRGQPVNPSTAQANSDKPTASATFGTANFHATPGAATPVNVEQPPAPVVPQPPPMPALSPAQAPNLTTPPAGATTPSLFLEKRCPETVNATGTLVYEIIVRNQGQSAVQQVRVDEQLPVGTRYVTSEPPAEATAEHLVWNVGTIDAGAERKMRVELQPGAEGEFHSTATVTFAATTAMRTKVVRPRLNVALTAPEQATAGDPVTMQIQVTNPGTGPVQNLSLRVKLAAGLQHAQGTHIEADLGTLPAGETKNIPLRVTAVAGGLQASEITAAGDGGLEAVAKAQVSVLQPQLQIRRAGPAKVLFKGEVIEELEIQNPGNAPVANLQVTEILPVGLEFIGGSDGATYDPAGRAVTWRLGPHEPGAIRRVTLKAKAVGLGEQATRATAAGERGLEAKAEGSVNVEGIPALMLEVVDLEDPIEVGGELTYEVRVVNQGSCPCTNIRILADIPEGLQAIDATGPTAAKTNGTQLAFEPLAKLAVKADAVFRIKVRGVQPNDYRFKVQMHCDQMRLPVNKEESSRVYKN